MINFGGASLIFNKDGQVRLNPSDTIEEGWYPYPVQTLYSADGRTLTVPQTEVEAHLQVGWYVRPVRTLYAADGRSIIAFEKDLEQWLAVGWYLTDVRAEAIAKVTQSDIADLANVMHSEANGLDTREVSMVAWCVLNRVDANQGSIHSICWSNQFTRRGNITAYAWLAEDVLIRWYMEKAGVTNVGRTLPSTHRYFVGDGKHNYFRADFKGKGELYSIFNNYPNPYV